jgi:hypothetical protein
MELFSADLNIRAGIFFLENKEIPIPEFQKCPGTGQCQTFGTEEENKTNIFCLSSAGPRQYAKSDIKIRGRAIRSL